MQYDPKKRLDIHRLASQFFLTREIDTFHHIEIKRSNMDLGQSIVLNSKETNPLWSPFIANEGLQEIVPLEYEDEKSIAPIKKQKGIVEEEVDVLGKMKIMK